MSNEAVGMAYQAIEEEYANEAASTRRKFVAGAGATLGGMGLLGWTQADIALAAKNDPQEILNIAATAEVLATIVNTVGAEVVSLDDTTKANVQAAARHELIHFETLKAVGAKELTQKIWVPDAVFASKEGLLNTLVVGDQIFINAYLIGLTTFAKAKDAKFARYAAEFMGVEAVHRALALQSLGKLGNDRAFMAYEFRKIGKAVELLLGAGFGFGAEGSAPGQFYNYKQVSKRTPNPDAVNTIAPK